MLVVRAAHTQTDLPCATDALHQRALQQAADFQKHQQLEQEAYDFYSRHIVTGRGSQALTVPVVVHVIHDNGPENISDAAVQQAVQWLNEAFANAGYFDQGSGADAGIQFCLAQRTPDGQPTNGITRDQSTLTVFIAETQEGAMKNINRWKPKDYINIWVVRDICSTTYGCGIVAYAYYPSFHGSNIDGIVIEANFLNSASNVSVLAHEMGHYFGLYHTFEGGCTNNDCLLDGDRVCDTPPDQSTAAVPCDQAVNTCSTDAQSGFSTDQPDMLQNHMDYGHIDCKHDFTPGQADRMNYFLNGTRKSLLDSKGCLPPCPLPTLAAFTPGDTTINAGQTLFFDNTSQNAVIFSWTLNGVPFGGQQNASYLFDSAGVFTVKLVAQPLNGQLCEADSVQAIVQVVCPVTAGFTLSNLTPEEGETVFITNTSQNAMQYEWFVNGVSQGAVLDSIVFSESGSYDIRLVAKGSFCKSSATEAVFVRDSCTGKTFALYNNTPEIGPTSPSRENQAAAVLTDGNLIYAGFGTLPNTFQKAFFFKLKPDGTLLWTKLVGQDSIGSLSCPAVTATPDGGFAALIYQAFYSSTLLPNKLDMVKFSPDGDIEWTRKLYEDSTFSWNPLLGDLIVMQDGNILVGNRLKFDLSGNLLWYNTQPLTDALKTAAMPDGGFVTAGCDNCGTGSYSVARYDAAGNLLWGKLIEVSGGYIMDVAADTNGNIFLLGRKNHLAIVLGHTLMIKMAPTGEILWSRRYFRQLATGFDPGAIVATPDGITIGARADVWISPGNTKEYDVLMHTDNDGNIKWVRHYESDFFFNSLSVVPGGGYLLTDHMIKADALGYIGECPDAQWEVQYEDLSLSINDLTVGVSPATDYPLDSLPVSDYLIALDTICAPACPRGVEICNNNLDDDEDGLFDCLDPDCNCPEDVCAPRQANVWYFGDHAGLDFSTEPPTVLTDGQMDNFFGSATVCDLLGHLLFYTDGDTVYNRFHQPMPNGMNLVDISGNINHHSHAIVVPNPADKAQYYLFNLGPGLYSSFISYSLIDMRLENGQGDVVPGQKSVPFHPTTVETEFTAVRSCSFNGYWLLIRDRPANNFYAYKIGQNGLDTNPVFSPGGTGPSVYGQMKFSPDGKRVARNGDGGVIEIYDFDLSAGLVTNPVLINLPGTYLTLGIEFSPNGRYLYFSAFDSHKYMLYQIDLEAGTPDQVFNSLTLLAIEPNSSNVHFGTLQLAPNGKIYVSPTGILVSSADAALHIVHQPDLAGTACQFQKDGQSLAPIPLVSYGLVNIASNLFAQPAISFSKVAPDTICILDSLYTYTAEKSGCFAADSFAWKLEGLTGTLNHDHAYGWAKFDAPGSGRIIVTAHTECGIVSDTLPIVVAEPFDKTLDLGPDRVVCDNGVFTFNAGGGFARYRWQNGSPDSVLTTLLPGQYWVEVWDACGNRQTDTVTVSIAPATVLDLGDDREGCDDLTASFERPDFFSHWQWTPGNFTSCDTCASVTVSPAATTSWVVVAQTDDGCISVDTLTFLIRDTLFFQLDTSVCSGQVIDLFGISLPADTTAHFFFPAEGPGCDTLLTVNVLGLDAPLSELEATVCPGAFFDFNGTLLPADTTAVFLFSAAGNVCDSVVTVTVSAWPPLTLTLPPDTTLRVGATLVLNAETTGTGPFSFAWSPAGSLSCADCPDPLSAPLETTLYTLAATDANGCSAQDSVLVTVDRACVVVIPNAFTPNGDGVNDRFYPRTDPCVRAVRTWRVVSRWGEPVFERFNLPPDDPALGWDGNRPDGEPFPSDVLVWYVELEYYDGRKEVRNGDVALLR